MIHTIKRSAGCGKSYFDPRGIRRQYPDYYVRVWCECGWTGMTVVDEISELWKAHKEE